jgi:hypothetical protein
VTQAYDESLAMRDARARVATMARETQMLLRQLQAVEEQIKLLRGLNRSRRLQRPGTN